MDVPNSPKEVEVKWKECSRTLQEIQELTPDDELDQAAFDLAKPENSAWIQAILKDTTCGDLERSVCAFWRFSNVFSKLVHKQGHAKAAETASYLLQRGFSKELHPGLKDARFSGVWLLQPKLDGTGNGFFINRVEVYASVIEDLTVDERTARFFLKEIEALLLLLEGLFHQAAHPSLAKLTQQSYRDPAADVRRTIVRAFIAFIAYSGKAKRFMLKRNELYLEMIRESTKMFHSDDFLDASYSTPATGVNSGLVLISKLNGEFSADEQKDMLDDVFQLVATTLKLSDCAPLLSNCLLILRKMIYQEGVCAHLTSCEGLSEAFIAVAACTAYFNLEVRFVSALLAFETKQIALPVNIESLTQEQILKFCEKFADRNSTIKSRVERMAAASRDPIARTTPVLRRKCSNPACEKVEPKTERFKMCRGCLLEIYCSAGE